MRRIIPPMTFFAGLIRDEEQAAGDDRSDFSLVVLVEARDEEAAYGQIAAIAQKKGFDFEAKHDGSPIYRVLDRRS